MRFLCPVHRRHLFSLPPEQLCLIWQEWMGNAASFYQHRQWQEALPYLGCGFELSHHLLQQPQADTCNAAIQLTLNTIYLNNVLQHCADKAAAADAVACALRVFHSCKQQQQPQRALSDCMAILLDERHYEAFFSRYLNLPFEDVAVSGAVLH